MTSRTCTALPRRPAAFAARVGQLLGTTENAVRAEESPPELRPREVRWRERAPEGKLDLLTTIDFRMTSNALFSDVVLPAATWYEKYDVSSTDLHPFVHTFNQAVPPPWESKSDWEAFGRIAERFSELAADHLGVRRDVLAAPLMHDTSDELAQPFGQVRDWRAGECEPVPGKTTPKLLVVERDYPAVAQKWRALGPLAEELGAAVKGASWKPLHEVAELRAANGTVRGGVAGAKELAITAWSPPTRPPRGAWSSESAGEAARDASS
jgi:nitrate reductase alpha subunit